MGLFHGKITDPYSGYIDVDVNGVNRFFVLGDWADGLHPFEPGTQVHVELDATNSMAQLSRVWGPDGSIIWEQASK